jgi:hypothetical protein
MESKPTAGQQIVDRITTERTREMVAIEEIGAAMENNDSFTTKMQGYIAQGRAAYHHDFYITLEAKIEGTLANVGVPNIRIYPLIKRACPTPFYDQSVWKYHYTEDRLEFLWTVPDRDTCAYYRAHALEVVLPERELLNFVLSYYDGSLLRLAKKLNGETPETPSVVLSVIKE